MKSDFHNLTLPTSDIIISGHFYCQIPSIVSVQGVDTANGLCHSEISLLLYSSPECMTHSSCFAKVQRINPVGRGLWRPPVQSPDQSRANFNVRSGCAGPCPDEFLWPPRIFQRLTSLIMKDSFLMFSLNFPSSSSQQLHLVFNWILQGGADTAFAAASRADERTSPQDFLFSRMYKIRSHRLSLRYRITALFWLLETFKIIE